MSTDKKELTGFTVDRIEGDFAVCTNGDTAIDARVGTHTLREGDTVAITYSGEEYAVERVIAHADGGAHADREARLRRMFRKQ